MLYLNRSLRRPYSDGRCPYLEQVSNQPVDYRSAGWSTSVGKHFHSLGVRGVGRTNDDVLAVKREQGGDGVHSKLDALVLAVVIVAENEARSPGTLGQASDLPFHRGIADFDSTEAVSVVGLSGAMILLPKAQEATANTCDALLAAEHEDSIATHGLSPRRKQSPLARVTLLAEVTDQPTHKSPSLPFMPRGKQPLDVLEEHHLGFADGLREDSKEVSHHAGVIVVNRVRLASDVSSERRPFARKSYQRQAAGLEHSYPGDVLIDLRSKELMI